MAILQLSRITHRKGLAQDLPQLAAAELGWAIDDRKLYIGNGDIIDGAPVVGNTEILTEYSDVLGMASTYTYKGEAAGYVVVTGAGGEDILRSLQSKFDEVASVKDFGAVGDGIVDDTEAINRALFQLFCVQTNTQMRRALFFPAGTYRVTDIIKVPPHAKLFGDGITSSVINFEPFEVAATTMVADGRYAIVTAGTTLFTSFGAPNNDVGTVFTATGPATGTGTVYAVPDTVVETADSLQQTRLNIGNNGATSPTGIEMSSMAIYTGQENSLLRLDSVTNSGFQYVGLHGPNTNALVPGYQTAAVDIATSVSATHDVTCSKLDCQGTTYGLKAEGDIRGVVLETSGLDLHYKGVYVTNPLIGATSMVDGVRYKIVAVNDTDFTAHGAEYNREGVTFTMAGAPATGTGTVVSMDDPGPTGIVVSRNIFDNIAKQGVHFENTLFNSTGYNVFYNVGNDLGLTAATPVITFETDQCVSVGDLFEREDESLYPRVELAGNGGIYLDGNHSIHLGSYERLTGVEANLLLADSGNEIFKVAETAPNSYQVDYHIKTSTATKRGTITVTSYNGTVTYDDEFVETGSTGITLAAAFSGANSDSEIQFTAANDATINFSVVILD